MRWSIAAVLAAVAGTGLWLALAPDAPEKQPEEASARVTPRVAKTRPPRARPSTPSEPPDRRPEGDAVAGAGADDPHPPAGPPHPMDGARQRLHAENGLVQSLNDAMSFRRVERMRQLLAEYRKLDPTGVHANQAGYEVIADCIESPGEASLAAARRFYDTQRHSPLRRFVRRTCFENKP